VAVGLLPVILAARRLVRAAVAETKAAPGGGAVRVQA
jgi:hypothetical protein